MVKKLPAFHGTLKVPYRVHNSPPLVPILNTPHRLHQYSVKTHFKTVLSFIFPHHNRLRTFPLPYPYHIPRSSHSS
jgi:hypothetical protein